MKLKQLAILLALSTMAADCPLGDSTPTDPAVDPMVGTWILQTVNGVSLPAPYFDGSDNTTVTAGQTTVNANHTFSWSENRSIYNDAAGGTWSKSGDTYTFDPVEQNGEPAQANPVGTLSGTTFTFSVTDGSGTNVRVYQKQGS